MIVQRFLGEALEIYNDLVREVFWGSYVIGGICRLHWDGISCSCVVVGESGHVFYIVQLVKRMETFPTINIERLKNRQKRLS